MNFLFLSIPVLFLSSIVILLFGKKFPKIIFLGHIICFLVLVFSISTLFLSQEISVSFSWINLDNLKINLGFTLDRLSGLLYFVVSLISLIIQIYSLKYMKGDKNFSRYFAFLTFFQAAMIGLILTNNFLLLLIFWELVSLSSYLLIGFWYDRPNAAIASKKAFLTTKLGDLSLVFGLFLIFTTFHSFDFSEIFDQISATEITTLTVISLCIAIAAFGKSAQLPFSVWLPDAMAGPTPVSALIHAATMVAAGVYLIARMMPIFTKVSLTVVLIIGVSTAFISALSALNQKDIKKVLAFSTISQLGYMMAGLGVLNIIGGIFHLVTHAFFKALLFLAAGSIIHLFHTQNLDKIKSSKLKYTRIMFLIGALALAGIFPFSGFFSKEIILDSVFNNKFVFILLLFISFLTSFYIFRVYFKIFKPGEGKKESSIFIYSMMILAFFSIIAGFVFKDYIFQLGEGLKANIGLSVFGLLFPVSGILFAWLKYKKNAFHWLKIPEFFLNISKNNFYLDKIYEFLILNPLAFLSKTCAFIDQKIIDGFIWLIAKLTGLFSAFSRIFDIKFLDEFINDIGWFIKIDASILRKIQTGNIQTYIFVFLIGMIVLIFRFT